MINGGGKGVEPSSLDRIRCSAADRRPANGAEASDGSAGEGEALTTTRRRARRLRAERWRGACKPDFGVTSVNDDFAELLARAEEPA